MTGAGSCSKASACACACACACNLPCQNKCGRAHLAHPCCPTLTACQPQPLRVQQRPCKGGKVHVIPSAGQACILWRQECCSIRISPRRAVPHSKGRCVGSAARHWGDAVRPAIGGRVAEEKGAEGGLQGRGEGKSVTHRGQGAGEGEALGEGSGAGPLLQHGWASVPCSLQRERKGCLVHVAWEHGAWGDEAKSGGGGGRGGRGGSGGGGGINTAATAQRHSVQGCRGGGGSGCEEGGRGRANQCPDCAGGGEEEAQGEGSPRPCAAAVAAGGRTRGRKYCPLVLLKGMPRLTGPPLPPKAHTLALRTTPSVEPATTLAHTPLPATSTVAFARARRTLAGAPLASAPA